MDRQSKLSNIFADVRVDPNDLGKWMARSHLAIQERVFDFTLAFIRELSIQAHMSSYVNGNMTIANRAREIQELLTQTNE